MSNGQCVIVLCKLLVSASRARLQQVAKNKKPVNGLQPADRHKESRMAAYWQVGGKTGMVKLADSASVKVCNWCPLSNAPLDTFALGLRLNTAPVMASSFEAQSFIQPVRPA